MGKNRFEEAARKRFEAQQAIINGTPKVNEASNNKETAEDPVKATPADSVITDKKDSAVQTEEKPAVSDDTAKTASAEMPIEEISETSSEESVTTSKTNSKKKKGAKKSQKKEASKISKKMEDNQAAIMFYLPEDVKLDLIMYAKKQKKTVALLLREIVVEKIYS